MVKYSSILIIFIQSACFVREIFSFLRGEKKYLWLSAVMVK